MPPKLTPRQLAGRRNRKKRKGITPEGRERLRQTAIANRPWEHSTGPRTAAGKASSRWNAWQHGGRAFACLPEEARALIEALRLAERTGGVPPFALAEGATLAMMGRDESIEMFMRGMALYRRYLRRRMATLGD